MNWKTAIMKIIKGERPLIDIWHYIVGQYRYYIICKNWYAIDKEGNKKSPTLWNRFLNNLIRNHIKEQIRYRVTHMDRDCYFNGSCKMCGCETTALQMCSKSCDKPCYPPMMNKKQWHDYSRKGAAIKIGGDIWLKGEFNKPIRLKEKTYSYVQEY